MAGTHLLDLEGHVGRPPEDMPCSLLWVGAQAVDTCLKSLTTYVRGVIYDEIQPVKGVAMVAEAVARMANDDVVHQTRMTGLDNVSNLTVRVGDLESMVTYLQTMLQEAGDMMMSIVDGSIPVAGHQNSHL